MTSADSSHRREFLKSAALCGAAMSGWGSGKATAAEPEAANVPSHKAELIDPPKLIVPHRQNYEFIGPSVVRQDSGELLMAANGYGEGSSQAPMSYTSSDDGRTWKTAGSLKMGWTVSGQRLGGGVSFLKLHDGRLAVLMHRGLKQGGGLPAISYSSDGGETWTDSKLLDGPEGIWYVMNDRMIQTTAGRILAPVSRGGGQYEGDTNTALCFYSDNDGKSWSQSMAGATLAGPRGMQEPCVAELGDGRLLMLARTGKGSHHRSYSRDCGNSWSKPEPTTLTAACSPLTLKRMPDGRLIVLYDHAKPIEAEGFFPRTPLVYAVSANGGRTWSPPVVIDDEPRRQHIYPSICFLDEGILVFYSTHFSNNTFGMTAEQQLIGGGKRCILKYPV